MDLTFLGTRGEIGLSTRRHRRHSALLVRHNDAGIMIDCGTDWLGQLGAIAPTAIVLTHAHPDHAAGLSKGAPCPVYGTKNTLALLKKFPIRQPRVIPLRKSVVICGVRFKAFPVQHSIRAPAVGYRVSAQGSSFFYLPDVAGFPGATAALRGIDVYIGDGATMRRWMVRHTGGTLIGHAPMAVQLRWCESAGIRRAIFTHCGSPTVRGDARLMDALVQKLGREHGVDARIASDGSRLSIPGRSRRESRRSTIRG